MLKLEGLLTDGYTFICPKHGLHPNCNCNKGQIKVWHDDFVSKLLEQIEALKNEIKLCKQ